MVVSFMVLAGQEVHTVNDMVLGHSFVWTRDPENVSAMLTTLAGEFHLGMASQGKAMLLM